MARSHGLPTVIIPGIAIAIGTIIVGITISTGAIGAIAIVKTGRRPQAKRKPCNSRRD